MTIPIIVQAEADRALSAVAQPLPSCYHTLVAKPPIVVTGSIAIDRIMGFAGRYADYVRPERLDVLSVSIFLNQLTDTYGGVGANIAYSLALLGEEPYLLGAVGKDAVAYMELLARTGVNISHIYESDLPTASFNVITDADQNQIGGFYPGAMFDSAQLSFAPWKNQDPIIVLSPHDPKAMKRQVAECKKWGLTYCYDIGQQLSNAPAEDITEGVRHAKILVLNEYELTVLAKRTSQSPEAIKRAVPIVITTLGQRGAVIEGKTLSKPIQVGVVPAVQVADPTGAGDAFRAGFFYGYARDWPLRSCGQLGAVCATYAVETAGTQGHNFSLHDVSKRYVATFKESLPVVNEIGGA